MNFCEPNCGPKAPGIAIGVYLPVTARQMSYPLRWVFGFLRSFKGSNGVIAWSDPHSFLLKIFFSSYYILNFAS